MILFVSSDHIPHIGGKSTHIIDLMAGIEANKEKAILFSQAQYPSVLKKMIKVMLSPLKLYDSKYFQHCYGKIWRKMLSKRTIKLYKKYCPSCISCQDAFAAASLKSVRKEIKCPITLTMHTYFGLENSLDSKKNKLHDKIYDENLKFELESLEVVDKIIAVDNRILEHAKETIAKEKGKRRIKVSVCTSIENFTNTDTFKPGTLDERTAFRKQYAVNKDSFVIVCARRLVEKNGVLYAVKAMKFMGDNVVLMIAGSGPQLSIIQDTIEKENLGSKVILLGAVQPSDIVNLYKAADCSVVPSITVNGLQEATSISALEAMACGLPTIASAIGGLRQIIKDGENGFLVDERKPEQIAEALNKVRNKDLYDSLSENARRFVVENHSHIQGAKAYLREFAN